MKVICFIDSFNSGGAQKQMVMLANGLSEENEVKTLQYHDLNFFSKKINSKITRKVILSNNKFVRTYKIVRFLAAEKPDAIIAFLHGPSNYSAIYKMLYFWRRCVLVCGERNFDVNKLGLKQLLIRFSHLFANKIVCNSKVQLERLKPYFKKKLVFITNGVVFNDSITKEFGRNEEVIRLIVPARFTDQKNPLNLLKALNELSNVKIDWYGQVYKDSQVYSQCNDFLNKHNLDGKFSFNPPEKKILEKIIEYDALILPSFFEGCPNAVIDAMGCGMPVLASKVADNFYYLKHQAELVFDPHSIDDITSKIKVFQNMDRETRQLIGAANRVKSREFFDFNKMVDSYYKLIK